jgi:hypothetical protein
VNWLHRWHRPDQLNSGHDSIAVLLVRCAGVAVRRTGARSQQWHGQIATHGVELLERVPLQQYAKHFTM